MPPSIVPKVVKVGTTIIIMFTSIIINKENFKGLEVNLSNYRSKDVDGNPYVDSEGNPFGFYWVSFFLPDGTQYICCTGKAFTELLGTDADEDKLIEVLNANLGKFQISQATEDDGSPIYVQDDPDKPLLKIQKTPKRVSVGW
jgi:hypothetical protein